MQVREALIRSPLGRCSSNRWLPCHQYMRIVLLAGISKSLPWRMPGNGGLLLPPSTCIVILSQACTQKPPTDALIVTQSCFLSPWRGRRRSDDGRYLTGPWTTKRWIPPRGASRHARAPQPVGLRRLPVNCHNNWNRASYARPSRAEISVSLHVPSVPDQTPIIKQQEYSVA